MLRHLSGLLAVLFHGGFTELEVFDWLFRDDVSLPVTPVQALRDDRQREAVRRGESLSR